MQLKFIPQDKQQGTTQRSAAQEEIYFFHPDHLEGGALKKCLVDIFSERASLSRWVYLSDANGFSVFLHEEIYDKKGRQETSIFKFIVRKFGTNC